jgi:uncharacterized protein (TIGR00369 family)
MTPEQMEADGWKPMRLHAFSQAIGQTWRKGPRGKRLIALPSDERTANDHISIVHGGVLMTFADIALGLGVLDVLDGAQCVTVQLQCQFVAAAPVGSMITCEPEVVRQTSRLVFARGLIKAGDEVVSSAEGIFKIVPVRRDIVIEG